MLTTEQKYLVYPLILIVVIAVYQFGSLTIKSNKIHPELSNFVNAINPTLPITHEIVTGLSFLIRRLNRLSDTGMSVISFIRLKIHK